MKKKKRKNQSVSRSVAVGDATATTGVDAILHVLLLCGGGVPVAVCFFGVLLAFDALGPVLVELDVLLPDLFLALLGFASTAGPVF